MVDQRNETVIATGSSGLIGAPVLRRLARSFRAVGFDRESNPPPPREAECVCVDIGSEQSVWDGLDRVRYACGNRIASIIHLAAYYDFSGEPGAKYEEITVRGTERLICGLQDFDVERFVFSSTMLLHAPPRPGQHITDGSAVDPKREYPKAKVRTEEILRAQRGEIPIVSLGIAGVYDDERRSIPIAHHIQRIYERQGASHLFPGDPGRGRQSFVHQDDLLSAFERLVECRSQLLPRLALLIAEPEAPSYGELQEELGCLIHGEEWKAREVPESVARAGAWLQDKAPLARESFTKRWMVALAEDDYELDITRARSLLGWEPQHSLHETLPKMAAALKADRPRLYRANKLDPPPWLEYVATQAAAPERNG